jgi:hypothetical protein
MVWLITRLKKPARERAGSCGKNVVKRRATESAPFDNNVLSVPERSTWPLIVPVPELPLNPALKSALKASETSGKEQAF